MPRILMERSGEMEVLTRFMSAAARCRAFIEHMVVALSASPLLNGLRAASNLVAVSRGR